MPSSPVVYDNRAAVGIDGKGRWHCGTYLAPFFEMLIDRGLGRMSLRRPFAQYSDRLGIGTSVHAQIIPAVDRTY